MTFEQCGVTSFAASGIQDALAVEVAQIMQDGLRSAIGFGNVRLIDADGRIEMLGYLIMRGVNRIFNCSRNFLVGEIVGGDTVRTEEASAWVLKLGEEAHCSFSALYFTEPIPDERELRQSCGANPLHVTVGRDGAGFLLHGSNRLHSAPSLRFAIEIEQRFLDVSKEM